MTTFRFDGSIGTVIQYQVCSWQLSFESCLTFGFWYHGLSRKALDNYCKFVEKWRFWLLKVEFLGYLTCLAFSEQIQIKFDRRFRFVALQFDSITKEKTKNSKSDIRATLNYFYFTRISRAKEKEEPNKKLRENCCLYHSTWLWRLIKHKFNFPKQFSKKCSVLLLLLLLVFYSIVFKESRIPFYSFLFKFIFFFLNFILFSVIIDIMHLHLALSVSLFFPSHSGFVTSLPWFVSLSFVSM